LAAHIKRRGKRLLGLLSKDYILATARIRSKSAARD